MRGNIHYFERTPQADTTYTCMLRTVKSTIESTQREPITLTRVRLDKEAHHALISPFDRFTRRSSFQGVVPPNKCWAACEVHY